MASGTNVFTELATLRRVLQYAHPNVLIVAPRARLKAIIRTLTPLLAIPICVCLLPGRMTLPGVPTGTLVLDDVAGLRPRQQRDLLRWLDKTPHVQVISVTSSELFSLVRSGDFNDLLFYRLNVVSVIDTLEDALHSPEASSLTPALRSEWRRLLRRFGQLLSEQERLTGDPHASSHECARHYRAVQACVERIAAFRERLFKGESEHA
jgi:hypothetical protein